MHYFFVLLSNNTKNISNIIKNSTVFSTISIIFSNVFSNITNITNIFSTIPYKYKKVILRNRLDKDITKNITNIIKNSTIFSTIRTIYNTNLSNITNIFSTFYR